MLRMLTIIALGLQLATLARAHEKTAKQRDTVLASDCEFAWTVPSPDGKYLAATCPQDRSLHIWNLQTMKREHTLAHQGEVRFAAFVPGSSRVATCVNGEKTVYVWDLRPERVIMHLTHSKEVFFFSISGNLVCNV